MGNLHQGLLGELRGNARDRERAAWIERQLAARIGDRASVDVPALFAELEAEWAMWAARGRRPPSAARGIPGRRSRTAALSPTTSRPAARRASGWDPPAADAPLADTFAGLLGEADAARRTEAAQYRTPGRVDRRAVGAVEDDAPERLHELLACGGGHPLPAPLAGRLGAALGADLGRVRVHTGAQAADAAAALGAAAFAHGDDIYFAPGRYQPDTVEGQRLIAHEVAHTVQQRGAASAAPAELTVSEPGDAHEREADAFADAFVASPAAPRVLPASAAPLVTSVSRRLLQAERVYRPRPDVMHSADSTFVSVSNIELFGRSAIAPRTWDPLPATFVPLAGAAFTVAGVPIVASLSGQAHATTGAGLSFGPGVLQQARVFVTGEEAARQRRPPSIPMVGPLGDFRLPRLPPGPPRGRWGADAMLRLDSNANAWLDANARLSATLGLPLDIFTATAYAGVRGTARANADVEFEGYTNFTWDDGVADASITLDMNARASFDFNLNPYAGVEVALRFPRIQIVEDLRTMVASWPIVQWLAPSTTRWEWSRRYEKQWTAFQRRYDWQLQKQLTIGGRSPMARGGGSMRNDRGFDITQVLRDMQAMQQAGTMQDDPEGPGDGRRSGRAAGEVTTLAARARTAISTMRQAARRELQRNATYLREARAAAAHAPPGGAPSLAVGGGPADPVQQLTDRQDALQQSEASANELTQSATALNTPAAAADGPTRNQASEGYQAIATNADTLQNVIDTNQGRFLLPASVGPQYLGCRRVPGTNQFDGSFSHPDWNWDGFPDQDIERHPINEQLDLRQDTNQRTVRPTGRFQYTGRPTTGARAIIGEVRQWRRDLDDNATLRTDRIERTTPGISRQDARWQAEREIAAEYVAAGWPNHRFDFLKVLDHTRWECHHAHETSWDGGDGKSNLIYLSPANHTPFTHWWDRRRDDIKARLGI